MSAPEPAPTLAMAVPPSSINHAAADATNPAGPYMYRSVLPVPRRWFRPRSADAFRAMETRPSDVVISSLPKGGTTWMHRVLCCLLHEIDDGGNAMEETAFSAVRRAQPYPDGIPVDDEEMELALSGSREVMPHDPTIFGEKCTLQDLIDQPEPRLFSTHLFGEDYLPLCLLGAGEGGAGKGRLIVVLRNLKDTLTSLHHFMGVAKDDWHGNEYGPGSLARFLDPDSPNAYGSSFSWIEAQDRVVRKMQKEEGRSRVLVVYFERMKEDLPSELDRIAGFLGLGPLTDAKRQAVAEACGFKAMKEGGGGFSRGKSHLRSGKVGDWRNHMDEDSWKRLDAAFDERVGSVGIAQPLREYH